MKQSDLVAEVQIIIEHRISAGEIVAAEWLVMEVLHTHADISGDDTDFYLLCGHQHLRTTVRQVLRGYGANPEDELDQLEFPSMDGFRRLRKAYAVKRDLEQMIVPIEQLTDVELDAKAEEYDRMSVGCREHADELRRYRSQRTSAA